MSDWKPRRFWKEVNIHPDEGGFAVRLDERPVRTPGKALLRVPTEAMARELAAEWDAQQDLIDPRLMPFTRSANSAIDKVVPQRREVADMLAGYGDTDLLCYRAEQPVELVERQKEQWDTALDWAADELGARLQPWPGVVHQPQDPTALERLTAQVHGMNEFQLTGFHDLVALSGSLVLAFAAALNWRPSDEIWRISRLDELWQEEHWGQDDTAQQDAEIKMQAFLHAKRFYDLSLS